MNTFVFKKIEELAKANDLPGIEAELPNGVRDPDIDISISMEEIRNLGFEYYFENLTALEKKKIVRKMVSIAVELKVSARI